MQLSTRGQTDKGQKCNVFFRLFFSNLELSHHRWIIFFIFIFSSLQLESAAEISETLKLWNFLQFTGIHLGREKHNIKAISQRKQGQLSTFNFFSPVRCGIPSLGKAHTFHGPRRRHKTCSTSQLFLPPTKTEEVFRFTDASGVFWRMCEMKVVSPFLLEAVKWELNKKKTLERC